VDGLFHRHIAGITTGEIRHLTDLTMTHYLSQYLESIRNKARLDYSDEPGIMSELEAHIEDKLRELTEAGLSEEEAARTCVWEMGSTKFIARQIYEAYSQGSWWQVLMAAMPHFLVGLFFMLNWWLYPQWLLIILILTLVTALYGWGHGKPAWVFPWVGYCLIPVIAVGLILLYLPARWSLLGLVVYFPLALWCIFHVIIQTTKKDWLLSTLMLLPLPIIVGWLLAISPSGKFTEDSLEQMSIYAPWIGLSFMMLALTIATYIRLRLRWLRVSLLAVSGRLTLAIAIYLATGRLNISVLLGPALATWGVLLVPLLLERQLKNGSILPKKHLDIHDTGGLPAA